MPLRRASAISASAAATPGLFVSFSPPEGVVGDDGNDGEEGDCLPLPTRGRGKNAAADDGAACDDECVLPSSISKETTTDGAESFPGAEEKEPFAMDEDPDGVRARSSSWNASGPAPRSKGTVAQTSAGLRLKLKRGDARRTTTRWGAGSRRGSPEGSR